MNWYEEDYVKNEQIIGILGAGYTGMAGGQAIAEIIVGKVNPSKWIIN